MLLIGLKTNPTRSVKDKMELVDLYEIKVMETDGMTFWAKKNEDRWSRNIIDMIDYLKERKRIMELQRG